MRLVDGKVVNVNLADTIAVAQRIDRASTDHALDAVFRRRLVNVKRSTAVDVENLGVFAGNGIGNSGEMHHCIDPLEMRAQRRVIGDVGLAILRTSDFCGCFCRNLVLDNAVEDANVMPMCQQTRHCRSPDVADTSCDENLHSILTQTGIGTSITCPVGVNFPVSRSMRKVTMLSLS